MKKYLFLFAVFAKCSYASFDLNHNMQRAYDHILNLEFDKASEYILEEERSNSNNGFIYLYKNYIDCFTILITEDYNLLKKIEIQRSIRLSNIESMSKNSPYYLFVQAEIHLQWAFLRLKSEDYIKASYEFIRSYRLFKENQELHPYFMPNLKGLGLLHCLLGVVPDQYHWVLNLAGLQGDINLGFYQLDMLLNNIQYEMYKDEVLFLVSILHTNLSNDNILSMKYLEMIGERYKDNYLLNFAAARLSYHLADNDYCIKVLENRPILDVEYSFLDYFQAMSYLYKLDYEKANKYFLSYLNHYKGKSYIKSSYQKLAWISYLQNDSANMNIYLEKVLYKGDQINDVDKVALRQAKQRNFSHPYLLKSRLLYDGGYYSLALSELNQIRSSAFFSASYTQIEYWYRLARIESKLNNSDSVIISYYKKVLEIGKNSTSYYAPMSALQIGLIYEKEKDFDQARYYFKKCLTMSGFDYQNGIHRRAKSYLSKMED